METIALWILIMWTAPSPAAIPIYGFESEAECKTAHSILKEGYEVWDRYLQADPRTLGFCIKAGTKQIYPANFLIQGEMVQGQFFGTIDPNGPVPLENK